MVIPPMSTTHNRSRSTDRCPIVPRPRDRDRYVALGTTENEVVIFDREIDSAWVKSSSAIELESME